MRAGDPDTNHEVRGHVCCRLPLILTASLSLAQKLPQLESQLRAPLLDLVDRREISLVTWQAGPGASMSQRLA